MDAQLDYLDAIAIRAAKGDTAGVSVLSTGERLYVALAANSAEMLQAQGYTVAEALARLGPDWTAQLIRRWQYRDDTQKFELPTSD